MRRRPRRSLGMSGRRANGGAGRAPRDVCGALGPSRRGPVPHRFGAGRERRSRSRPSMCFRRAGCWRPRSPLITSSTRCGREEAARSQVEPRDRALHAPRNGGHDVRGARARDDESRWSAKPIRRSANRPRSRPANEQILTLLELTSVDISHRCGVNKVHATAHASIPVP